MAYFNFLFGLLEIESLSELSIMIEIIRKGVDPSWSTMKPHPGIGGGNGISLDLLPFLMYNICHYYITCVQYTKLDTTVIIINPLPEIFLVIEIPG